MQSHDDLSQPGLPIMSAALSEYAPVRAQHVGASMSASLRTQMSRRTRTSIAGTHPRGHM